MESVGLGAGLAAIAFWGFVAIAVLAELGIDISNHTSKSTEQFRNSSLNWVITVCDDAAENCPVWLGSGRVVHISFPDPAKAIGSDEERLLVFQRVRDDIGQRVLNYLSEKL